MRVGGRASGRDERDRKRIRERDEGVIVAEKVRVCQEEE